jgi:hypothetical protein
MPRLHKYRNRNACYVLTAIGGSVITYQLTPEGEKKLTAAGIACGQQFPRALLLDLYRTGDAYTGGSGADEPPANQIELDFTNDPDPETAFPTCDFCTSVNDLHLTLIGKAEELIAQLQCATCRTLPAARPDTSIPVALLSRPTLARLFELKAVAGKGRNVKQFEELLRTKFESKWEALRVQRRTSQSSLFSDSTPGTLPFD